MKTKLILGLMLFFGLFANANEIKKDKEELKKEEDIYKSCNTAISSAYTSDGQKVTVKVTYCTTGFSQKQANKLAYEGSYALASAKAHEIADWESAQ